jgi:Polyketide cyclase / dehydrase and lipid transport
MHPALLVFAAASVVVAACSPDTTRGTSGDDHPAADAPREQDHKMTSVEGSFQLPMSPAEAFEWFTPEGEREWADGWHPRYPAGETHLEPGLVFVAEAHGDTLLWVVTAVDAGEIIEYAMTVPDDRAGTVSVRLEPANQGSLVTVRYKMTVLSASGQPKIERLRRDFTAALETWRTSIINAASRADHDS